MSSNSTWLDTQIAAEGFNALYVGINLQDILYGIELSLYLKTIHVFLTRKKVPRGFDLFYAVFSTVMLLLVTVWVATDAIYGQETWVLNPSYPGGPTAYAMAHASDTYLDVGGAAAVILQLMTDGLMVHRCRLVWDSRRAIIIPSILWLASFVLGIMVLWVARRSGHNFYSGLGAQIGMAYYSVSVVLSVALTCMICYRLVRYGRKVKEFLGDQYASPYFTMIMLFVESVLPYTLSGIALMISYGTGSQSEITFSRVYTLMMCVSPQMLILRVAEGTAWQEDSIRQPLSVIQFSPRDGLGGMSGSECCDESDMDGCHLETLSKSDEVCKV